MSEHELGLQNSLNCRIGKQHYFVIYSQAEIEKLPTRESFGKVIEGEFYGGSSQVKVSHWACCKENHVEGGFHYHCCGKLTGVKKWLSETNNITKNITLS